MQQEFQGLWIFRQNGSMAPAVVTILLTLVITLHICLGQLTTTTTATTTTTTTTKTTTSEAMLPKVKVLKFTYSLTSAYKCPDQLGDSV